MKNLIRFAKDWYISYDIYTDVFQMYNDIVMKQDRSDFFLDRDDDLTVVFSKLSSEPVLFEIKNLYNKVKVDVNTLTKSEIISLIEPFINQYEQKTN